MKHKSTNNRTWNFNLDKNIAMEKVKQIKFKMHFSRVIGVNINFPPNTEKLTRVLII